MSVDAAALIAQVLPVGILVLVLESRRGMSGIVQGTSFGRVLALAYWIFFIVASFGGTTATALCVGAVIEDEPLGPVLGTLVAVLSYLVFLSVSLLMSLVMFNESGVVDASIARDKRMAAKRAARKAARQGRHEAKHR
jgi:hypothetical protein